MESASPEIPSGDVKIIGIGPLERTFYDIFRKQLNVPIVCNIYKTLTVPNGQLANSFILIL